jgi:hypothetical protein
MLLTELDGTETAHLAASAADLFDLLVDVDRLPEWNAHVHHVVERPDGPLASGVEWVIQMRAMGTRCPSRSTALIVDRTAGALNITPSATTATRACALVLAGHARRQWVDADRDLGRPSTIVLAHAASRTCAQTGPRRRSQDLAHRSGHLSGCLQPSITMSLDLASKYARIPARVTGR